MMPGCGRAHGPCCALAVVAANSKTDAIANRAIMASPPRRTCSGMPSFAHVRGGTGRQEGGPGWRRAAYMAATRYFRSRPGPLTRFQACFRSSFVRLLADRLEGRVSRRGLFCVRSLTFHSTFMREKSKVPIMGRSCGVKAMHQLFVHRENLKHYKQLLERTTDDAERQRIFKLLAEEEANLAEEPQEKEPQKLA